MSDLIERQAAIDALEWTWAGKAAFDAIKNLPSAQPERKTGRWIYGENDGQDGWYCSECKGFIPWDYDFYGLNNIDFIKDFKTCPFCDSKMISCTGSENMER
ncbi:MAG: hypothetical protein IKF22_03535 [Lachnospiraceae bacterium]|nr:hypothetical protein [Lachnospiraceae bacterium]